jgi:hypothetical protein
MSTLRRILPALVSGDEPIVVTEHSLNTPKKGPLPYEARTGRLAIRSEDTGEVRAHIFFIAYVVKSVGAPRPITFAWNGGPAVSSAIINLEGLGPRRRLKSELVDNADTLLTASDLVFYDPIETSFSRPARPEFAAEFLNMKGDVAATVEFIRCYRARLRAMDQPLFIAGESYGAFRAAAVAETLSERKEKLAGTILVSGDIPNIPMPIAFYNAMHVPARTASAFHHKRLAPDLMKDREATLRSVNQWVVSVYQPALERVEQLSEVERESIALELARYIGISPACVDRKTLVVYLNQYLDELSEHGKRPRLDALDGRDVEVDPPDLGSATVIDAYLRDGLGYATDLRYASLEAGYAPVSSPPGRSARERFHYNPDGMKKEILDRTRKEGEATYIARSNPTWITNAMRADKAMRVFVATGRFDLLNMCEGNVAAAATLSPDLSARMFNHTYESGHVIYRDDAARRKLSADLSNFIRDTVAQR